MKGCLNKSHGHPQDLVSVIDSTETYKKETYQYPNLLHFIQETKVRIIITEIGSENHTYNLITNLLNIFNVNFTFLVHMSMLPEFFMRNIGNL